MSANLSKTQAMTEASSMATDDFSLLDSMDALSISVAPRHDTIGAGADVTTTQVCVTIKARDLLSDEHRAPVDTIVVLDVSGSMTGDKLRLCKKSLELFLRILKPTDRFGLVSFSSEACIEVPAQFMTAENKEAALRKIQSLHTRGCTNISAAIGLASQEMNMIENPNEVRSIFLLTDGHANSGITDVAGIVEATKNCLIEGVADAMDTREDEQVAQACNVLGFGGMFQSRGTGDESSSGPPASITVKKSPPPGKKGPPVTLHCFGYGNDHDSNFLRQVASATPGGTYYFVENDSNVGSAFGDALGGILSVVAQNAVVNIRVPPEAAALGASIVDVYHPQKVKRENGSYSITVGDFYAEESRDVVFEVTLANPAQGGDWTRIPHVEVTIAATDAIQKRPFNAGPVLCMINRPTGSEVSDANKHVIVQWLRVYATQEMAEAQQMANEDLGGARARVQKALDTIKETPGIDQSDALIAQLSDELKKVLQCLSSRQEYASGGAHYMQRTMQSHAMQRCSEATYETATVYRGSRKMAMAKKFNLD